MNDQDLKELRDKLEAADELREGINQIADAVAIFRKRLIEHGLNPVEAMLLSSLFLQNMQQIGRDAKCQKHV